MDKLCIYEIFKRYNKMSNKNLSENILEDNISINIDKSDNIHTLLNKSFKIIRDNILSYIKDTLTNHGFNNVRIVNSGEASKSIEGDKDEIKVFIDYRILANNLISLKYSLSKNKKKQTKQFKSIDDFFNDLKVFENEH